MLPYAKKVNQAIHDAGGMVCYHICGDTTKTIDDMADAGSDMISVDNVVDLEHVKNTAGQKSRFLEMWHRSTILFREQRKKWRQL